MSFLAMIGDLYRDLARPPFGFGPHDVDQWTWLQLQMVLGQHRPPGWWPDPEPARGRRGRRGGKQPGVRSDRDRDRTASRAAGRALNAERMRAHREGRAGPEAAPVPPGAVQSVMGAIERQ